MAAKISLEEAVNFLAQNNFAVEDGLERIVWLRQGAGEEIRLIEVNRNGFPVGRVEAFYFSPSEEVPFETYLADITPTEWQKILTGEIPLPKNWSLEGSVEFLPPEKETARRQTATLKRAAEDLGVSLEDHVSYQRIGNKALIEIDLKLSSFTKSDNVASEAIAGNIFQYGPNVEYPWESPDRSVQIPVNYYFPILRVLSEPAGSNLLKIVDLVQREFYRLFLKPSQATL